KLSAKDIYEKDFEKTMARGYRREEVDAFLDDIIADYQKMADMNNEVVKLSEENHKLKKELEELRLRVATSRPQDNKSFSSNNTTGIPRPLSVTLIQLSFSITTSIVS
ncbi:DivIVA domain-containing protein, partial [Staphylococcus aureus]|nr:DivIVA domain-containing protein [Staphylococcus aureus]